MATEPDEEEQKEEEKVEQPNREESLEEAALKALETKEETKDEQAKSEEGSEKEEEKSAEEEAKPDDKAKAEEGEEGYFADEGDVEEGEDEEELPAEDSTASWLLEQLPNISVTGHRGERAVSLNVKRADDLPKDFEFDSQRDAAVFYQAIADQTQRAYQLVNQLQTQRQQQQNDQFTTQENRDIQADIAQLQRDGEIPLFTRGTDVDSDPKAETAREVLDFYNKENVKRLEDAQQNGRLFHHLSYRDAYYLWKAQNPQTSKEQKAEDEERKEITRTQARGQRQGAREGETRKMNLPRTANWDTVINAALGE